MRANRKRRGLLSVELLFVLPIVLIMLFGMIEFSGLLLARQQLLAASREGVRVAALGGAADEVDAAVHAFLGTGPLGAATVDAMLNDPNTNMPLPSGSAVAVTVTIPAKQAVPDLLAFAGLSLQGNVLIVQSVMRKE